MCMHRLLRRRVSNMYMYYRPINHYIGPKRKYTSKTNRSKPSVGPWVAWVQLHPRQESPESWNSEEMGEVVVWCAGDGQTHRKG